MAKRFASSTLEDIEAKRRKDHMVILLCPRELDNNMNMILKGLKWAHRVIYIRGSALKDGDLKRCRIQEAGACFILPARSCMDRHTADHHTILRSWAVKDFSPHCPQYIHLFKAENKMHVKFAEHVICEDEFKYALLANNCLYPGLSTLVTILLHTSRGQEGELASERWQQIYGRHSGNEIYHIRLKDSVFFNRYDGMRFPDASADAHRRLGVGLVAVKDGEALDSQLLLNPGPDYILKDCDTCFYMSVTKEEYSEVVKDNADTTTIRVPLKGSESMAMELQNLVPDEDDSDDDCMCNSSRPSTVTFAVQDTIQEESEAELNGLDENLLKPMLPRKLSDRRQSKILEMYSDMGQEEIISGIPPVTLYLGAKQIMCHLVRTKRPHCCLKWGLNCVHCRYKNATDDRWDQQLIILTAEYASKGIYNFIVPLRSHYLQKNLLSPIILMLEQEPDSLFLEFIAHFPLVYWMKGKITNVDDLINAGINKADHIVIVNRELDNGGNEETLCDSQTIVAVQTLLKLFPNASIMTELSQASNMRFMHFRAHDEYTYKISKLERKIKENIGSNLSFMFRLPFAAGRVFSASMLDSLLYQTYVKDYLITFVHLLLGIDHAEKSGHLSSIRIKRSTLARFPCYEDLYAGLSSTTGEIPIAIYRSERQFSSDNLNEELHNNNKPNKPIFKRSWSENYSDQQEVTNLIRKRLESLHFDPQNYCENNKNRNLISFIILNPSPRRRLKQNDIVYVLQPSSMCAKPPNAHNQSRRRTATASFAKAKVNDG